MTHSRTALFATVIVAVATAGYMTAVAQNANKAKPTAVAVLDVQEAFNNLKEKVKIESNLQAEAQRIKQEHSNRQNKLKQLQADLEIMPKNSDTYKQKREELERGAIDLQVWLAYNQQKINSERVLQTEALYNKMMKATAAIADGKGYDIVLFKEPEFNLPSRIKPEQIGGFVQMRKVLWSRDGLDITQAVIQDMNAKYQAGGSGTP